MWKRARDQTDEHAQDDRCPFSHSKEFGEVMYMLGDHVPLE